MTADSVFICHQCGQCCEGSGGIVLSPSDLSRLAAFLGLSATEVIECYAETHNGKLRVKTGESGFCVFFQPGQGCAVHPGKPDICRAWPWFRGNLEDEASFNMAKEYCPGICKNASHADFIREGHCYLAENRLMAQKSALCANSLLQAEQN